MTKGSLRRIDDQAPGITRQRNGDGFTYRDADGHPLSSAERERIDALAVPPAWSDVWISADPQGHIQATGRDDEGRKQYIYHPQWHRQQGQEKFDRLESFGRALPDLRTAVLADLHTEGLPREKVVAAVVRLMERAFVRVGSGRYARENGSFGASSVEKSHVEQVSGQKVRLRFDGKGGAEHRVDLEDPRVARVVRRCQDLPGARLFEYVDEDGEVHEVGPAHVNAYLRAAMDGPFTSKDLRTWSATVIMLQRLLQADKVDETAREEVLRQTVKEVAQELEHTPDVCKKSYIHPAVPAAYLEGSLNRRVENPPPMRGMWPEERRLVRLFESYR